MMECPVGAECSRLFQDSPPSTDSVDMKLGMIGYQKGSHKGSGLPGINTLTSWHSALEFAVISYFNTRNDCIG